MAACTLGTGRIVSKDAAAEAVAPTLTAADRALLERARDDYLGCLGTCTDDWSRLTARVTALTHTLADRARQSAPRP